MAYSAETTYLNKDQYLEFSGIDLDIELKSGYTDNPSKQCEIFLKQTQTWLYSHISNNFEVNEDEWDDDTFTEAMKWQVKHILDYGEDRKLDDMAYEILHNAAIINPSRQHRYFRWY